MWNTRLREAQAGINISGRNLNNLRYADDTTLLAESEEELKSLLQKVKEKSEKAGLDPNIQKSKIMAPGPITSWLTDGEKVEAVTFYFLGLQNHCRWWLKPWNEKTLALQKKTMTNLESIWKSRDITLQTKVHTETVLFFPVVVYGCERWTIKKAEYWSIDASEWWCYRRLLRIPWTARRSNQSILKEINPEYSLWYWSWSYNSLATWCEEPTEAGKDWEQEEKRAAEDELVGWYHQLNGHEWANSWI